MDKLVLLVDGNPNLLWLLQDYLEHQGINSITALSEKEGWKRYQDNKPDVVVSGIVMQTTECGYNLISKIRGYNSKQPFIFLSGQLTIVDKRNQILYLGADDCFSKPFEPDELLTSILKLL